MFFCIRVMFFVFFCWESVSNYFFVSTDWLFNCCQHTDNMISGNCSRRGICFPGLCYPKDGDCICNTGHVLMTGEATTDFCTGKYKIVIWSPSAG